MRSAQSARSYEGMEQVVKPTATQGGGCVGRASALLDHLVGPKQY